MAAAIVDWVAEEDTNQALDPDAVMSSDTDGSAEADRQPTMSAACRHDGSLGCLADIPEMEDRRVAWHLDSRSGAGRAGLGAGSRGSGRAVDSLHGTETEVVAAEPEVGHQFVVVADYFGPMAVAVGQGLARRGTEHCLPAVAHPSEEEWHHPPVAVVAAAAADRPQIEFAENLEEADWRAMPEAADSGSDMAAGLGSEATEHPAHWDHDRGEAFPAHQTEEAVPADRRSCHGEDLAIERPEHVAAAKFEQYSLWDQQAAPNTPNCDVGPHDR